MKGLCIVVFAVLSAVMTAGAEEQRFPIPLEGSPSFGPANAAVTIVEFIDFQ